MTCRVAVNAMTTVAGSVVLARAEVQHCSSHMTTRGGAVGWLVTPQRTRQTATLPPGAMRSAAARAPRLPRQHNAFRRAHRLLMLGTRTLTVDGMTCRVAVNAMTTVAGSVVLARAEVQ